LGKKIAGKERNSIKSKKEVKRKKKVDLREFFSN